MWPSQRLASISLESGQRKAKVRRRDRRTRGIRPIVTLLEERTLLSQLPLTVNSLANSGVGTLQAAIAQANDHTANQYLITFAVTGTIDLTSALPDLTNNITIQIQGPGASSLTVSGGGSSSNFSVFTVNSGVTASISGLTISNGNASYGGGVYNSGNLTLTNDTLSGNSAQLYGGGVYNSGTATLTNDTLSGNSAQQGGGVVNFGTATLTNDTLSGNSASEAGGGVINIGTATLTNDTLSGNSAQQGGGGVINDSTATLTNDTLSGNSAQYGGGVYNYYTATLNNTVVANSPSGGDIFGSVSGSNNLIDDASTAAIQT